MSTNVYALFSPELPKSPLSISADTGLIYCIQDSIRQPFYELLSLDLRTPPNKPPAHAIEARSRLIKNSRLGRKRPCIVMPYTEGHRGQQVPPICLMSTFEGIDVNTLPELFQHFIVPVHPMGRPGLHSFRTTPSWRSHERKPQWIIAIPYVHYYRPPTERWFFKTQDNPTGMTFLMSHPELLILDELSRTLRQKWHTQGQGKKKRAAREFLDSKVDWDFYHPHHRQSDAQMCPPYARPSSQEHINLQTTEDLARSRTHSHPGIASTGVLASGLDTQELPAPQTHDDPQLHENRPDNLPQEPSASIPVEPQQFAWGAFSSDDIGFTDSDAVMITTNQAHINPKLIVTRPTRARPPTANDSTRRVTPTRDTQQSAASLLDTSQTPSPFDPKNALGLMSPDSPSGGSAISTSNQMTHSDPLLSPFSSPLDSTASSMSEVRRGKMPMRSPGEEKVRKRSREESPAAHETRQEPVVGTHLHSEDDHDPTARQNTGQDREWPAPRLSTVPPADHALNRKRPKRTKRITPVEGAALQRPYTYTEGSESVLLNGHVGHNLDSSEVLPPSVPHQVKPPSQRQSGSGDAPDGQDGPPPAFTSPSVSSGQPRPSSQRQSGSENALGAIDENPLETSVVAPPAHAPSVSKRAGLLSRRQSSGSSIGSRIADVVKTAKSRASSVASSARRKLSGSSREAAGGYAPINDGRYFSGPISESPPTNTRRLFHSEPYPPYTRRYPGEDTGNRNFTKPSLPGYFSYLSEWY
ncbi:hypothetical protein PLICRDRAFT_56571 [Plicaturopsis crispa FD-325 SS-3]|nr:hypothetical protein PLICRDRAFT_56571 [Plicaturopsis crispa FD-325 SS-3]